MSHLTLASSTLSSCNASVVEQITLRHDLSGLKLLRFKLHFHRDATGRLANAVHLIVMTRAGESKEFSLEIYEFRPSRTMSGNGLRFASDDKANRSSVLQVAAILPTHYALEAGRSGYPGFVVEAARSACEDWESQESVRGVV
jgi:hypothetical protein